MKAKNRRRKNQNRRRNKKTTTTERPKVLYEDEGKATQQSDRQIVLDAEWKKTPKIIVFRCVRLRRLLLRRKQRGSAEDGTQRSE